MSRVLLRCCAFALVLALGACEPNAQCAAECVHSLDVALHRQAWPAGEYALTMRYDAYRRLNDYSCTFTLPGGEDAICVDDRPDGYRVELSFGATVTLHVPNGPTHIALELQGPGGETRMLELTPPYDEHELCGQTCRSGSVTASLDEAP